MPGLSLHNSMTRRREQFVPLDPQHVRIYVCGPTVYDLAHVGNARGMTVYDVLVRLLRHLYPRVTYVRNVTDVDDKINARAAETGEPISAVTARTLAQFHEDMAALGNLPPDVEPRATGHVAEMIALIEQICHKQVQCGYEPARPGDQLFYVSDNTRFANGTGWMPRRSLEQTVRDIFAFWHANRTYVMRPPQIMRRKSIAA